MGFRGLRYEKMAGEVMAALMHRIQSELLIEACLGGSSTRMGDLMGSPRFAPPLFLDVFGSYGVPFRPSNCCPNGFDRPHRHRRQPIVDPTTRSEDTGRRNRVFKIFPRFLPHGRSNTLRTIDGNGKIFGRPGRK